MKNINHESFIDWIGIAFQTSFNVIKMVWIFTFYRISTEPADLKWTDTKKNSVPFKQGGLF